MGRRRSLKKDSKKNIVDAIIAEATKRIFTGDKRDGDAPPITLQNFLDESLRFGAKALRARLSRLSRAALLEELKTAAEYVDRTRAGIEEAVALAKQNEREAAARASPTASRNWPQTWFAARNPCCRSPLSHPSKKRQGSMAHD
jgi:hypothetical protein